jgi:hypothetical protein
MLRRALAVSIGLTALAAPTVALADSHRPSGPAIGCAPRLFGDPFSRTELFFGLSRSNGPEITDAQFDSFVDGVITERFPDGLTVLDGSGQFRNASGVTIEEPSRLVILLYPPGDPTSSDRIEEIRRKYKKRFDQESVLRVDEASCVSF